MMFIHDGGIDCRDEEWLMEYYFQIFFHLYSISLSFRSSPSLLGEMKGKSKAVIKVYVKETARSSPRGEAQLGALIKGAILSKNELSIIYSILDMEKNPKYSTATLFTQTLF